MSDEQDKKILTDKIAELESQVNELERDLIHDSLTGLKTRAFFEDESKAYLEIVRNVNIGKRKNWFGFKNISFLFFDIDHFKKVNDTYGHDIGDAVLRKVAQIIKNSLRIGDTAARWGGEEMVASLLGADLNDAEAKAEEIRKKIEGISFDEAENLKITISVGVVSSHSASTFEELMKKADEALYKSKETGRNKVTVFDEKS